MIHATVRYYPNQVNKSGARGVWRVIHCQEINYRPYKPCYTVLWQTMGGAFLALRVLASRMYKVGSRVDPRKMLGV